MAKMDAVNKTLPDQMEDAIDKKAAESGQVMAQFIMERLQEHSKALHFPNSTTDDFCAIDSACALRERGTPGPR